MTVSSLLHQWRSSIIAVALGKGWTSKALVNEELSGRMVHNSPSLADQLLQCLSQRASEKLIPPAETSVDSASVRRLSQMGMHGQRHPAIIDHERILQAQERTKLAQPKS
jgi:hypothetical protein